MAYAVAMATTEPIRTIPAGRPLQAHLRDGPLLPIYLVTTAATKERRRDGPPPSADPAELIAARRQIEDVVLRGADRRVDHAVVDYADDNREEGVHAVIANEARSTSLFGGRRVVSVTHADALDYGSKRKKPGKSSKSRSSAASADPLQLLLETLPDSGDPPVVLIFQASRFDRRKAAFKELAAKGAVVEVRAPDAGVLRAYIEQSAQRHNIRVDRAVAQRLWDLLGGADPARLRQTADRLLLDVGEGGHLTTDRVMDLVPRDRESQVFAITDAINAGEVVTAFEVAHLLIEHGDHPLMLIGALAAHYRRLLQVQGAMDSGASHPDQVASALKLHPFYAKKLVAQVRRIRPAVLERAMRTLAEADLALKQTAIGEAKKAQQRWFEEVILALVRGRALRDRWRAAEAWQAV